MEEISSGMTALGNSGIIWGKAATGNSDVLM